MPLTLRLYSSSLSFAVNKPTSRFALQPLQPVPYIEHCTGCPSSRMGDRCEQCTEGHSTDPSNGGEFSRCVECFCNFHSDTCHSTSGECFNCTGNTFGVDCERCLTGYARQMPLTLLPCDQCDDRFWDPNQNGTCIRKKFNVKLEFSFHVNYVESNVFSFKPVSFHAFFFSYFQTSYSSLHPSIYSLFLQPSRLDQQHL